jgi:hypothetical protein
MMERPFMAVAKHRLSLARERISKASFIFGLAHVASLPSAVVVEKIVTKPSIFFVDEQQDCTIMETPQSSRYQHGGGGHRSRRSSIGVDEAPYHAPLSHFDQLAAELHLVGFTAITVEDLQETKKDKIRALYAFLLEICAGITEEELENRAALYRMKCQEVYQYTFADVLHTNFVDFIFYLELKAVVAAAGYDKFSLRDLHAPTSKRLQIILSNLINFCKYRELQIPVYTSLMESRYKITAHYENLVEEKDGLLEQRAMAQEEAEDRTAEVEQLAARCAELERLYMDLSAQQAQDRTMGEKAKKASELIMDQIETARWEVENIMDKMVHLESTAVTHSPERKIQLCQDRKRALDGVKQEHMKVCEQIETASAVVHQARSYQQPLVELQGLAVQFNHVQDKLRYAKTKDADIRAQIRDVDLRRDEVDQTIEQEERTLARLQYQLDHSGQENKEEIGAEDEYRRRRTEALAREEQAARHYHDLEKEYQELLASQRAELKALDKAMDEMVDDYCEKLDVASRAVVASSSFGGVGADGTA